jgi:ribosome-binding protein aMBF1 (putative translation factor)
MQRALDTNKTAQTQADFALRVKVALLQRGETISDLAKSLNLSRNTVSLAVNRGLYEPTKKRIAKLLLINP